ncbi:MAG: hypothetical protein Sylvanvirus6_4 [Sylvanvirus sp.]|uniref:Uncharacterized protein n=1 Tax=Sylvanvirus sp. TaxID=2487774 RepID=A0A3G5AKC3_9VIRU|nr:MAG: hypothetical protein Sylvanvirus6_4 [Sylvanvirus sp.]
MNEYPKKGRLILLTIKRCLDPSLCLFLFSFLFSQKLEKIKFSWIFANAIIKCVYVYIHCKDLYKKLKSNILHITYLQAVQ